MAKRKNVKGGIFSAAAGFLFLLIIAVFAADRLDIYKLEDWKSIFANNDVQITDDVSVHFINVGQGDCSLINAKGKIMLIDTGEKEYSETVLTYLENQGIKKIDYLVLSHPHSDHMGGAAAIIDAMDIDEIIVPLIPKDLTPTTKTYENFLKSVKNKNKKLTRAKPGNIIELGEAQAEILSPLSDEYENLNNYSITIMLTHGRNKFLFTGDTESQAENDIIKSGRLKDVDVLKVAHHGSSTSSKKKYLDIVNPEYAVIMCGDNSYNHPNEKTVDRLEDYTDKIYRTDLQGTIVFVSGKNGLKVKTEN